jgi:hypothetical protein
MEFGGTRIGRMNIDAMYHAQAKQQLLHQRQMEADLSMDPPPQKPPQGPLASTYKWKLTGRYRSDFPAHFTQVFISDEQGYYLLGGNGNLSTC